MSARELRTSPITAEQFAPFGEVIDKNPARKIAINAGRFDRFEDLATVDVSEQGGHVNISLFSCRTATALPFEIKILERHPLGSQAFMPLSKSEFIAVVAPPGERVAAADLRAFRISGEQGVNLRRGVWHLPLIGQFTGQEFLVVDRAGGDTNNNCDEYELTTRVVLVS